MLIRFVYHFYLVTRSMFLWCFIHRVYTTRISVKTAPRVHNKALKLCRRGCGILETMAHAEQNRLINMALITCSHDDASQITYEKTVNPSTLIGLNQSSDIAEVGNDHSRQIVNFYHWCSEWKDLFSWHQMSNWQRFKAADKKNKIVMYTSRRGIKTSEFKIEVHNLVLGSCGKSPRVPLNTA